MKDEGVDVKGLHKEERHRKNGAEGSLDCFLARGRDFLEFGYFQGDIRQTELSAVPWYSPLISGFAGSTQHSHNIHKNRGKRRQTEVERRQILFIYYPRFHLHASRRSRFTPASELVGSMRRYFGCSETSALLFSLEEGNRIVSGREEGFCIKTLAVPELHQATQVSPALKLQGDRPWSQDDNCKGNRGE
ncbi:unnamed protein product [Pleuronectes platessa]|uniref:Uncharacterized protein n=1 Tax=Pleuronectes platessa TaxID=8262 RepID=A0A9N7VSS4_PLEPL|nr:unnamed protein product [Pleuronectes platessa]